MSMHALAPLPDGSRIEIERAFEDLQLSWPHPPGPIWMKLPMGLFLCLWLCGWAVGEVFAITILAAGMFGGGQILNAPGGGGVFVTGFLLLWLTMWTIGGATAIWTLVNLVRPDAPARLTLGVDTLAYHPGRHFNFPQHFAGQGFKQGWPSSPTAFTVPRGEIGAIKLDFVGDRQRLTIDRGVVRLEIGMTLSEPEREWLAEVITAWKG